MEWLEKYKIRVSKQVLLLLAGVIWSIAGWRVITLGYQDLFSHVKSFGGYLLVSAAVFYLFEKFIFRKMVKKHTRRILRSQLADHCIFSFFDFKGYLVMIFMMSGGIMIRQAHVFQPQYLGTFYLGLGTALLMAGMMFLVSGLNFEKIKREI